MNRIFALKIDCENIANCLMKLLMRVISRLSSMRIQYIQYDCTYISCCAIQINFKIQQYRINTSFEPTQLW